MTGSTPLGQETALLIGIGPTFLHLLTHRGPHQVHQGEQSTEGIPKTGIGKEIARQGLAVIGAVVNHLSLSINLEKAAGEEDATIKTAIESTQAIHIALVLYIDSREDLVPFLTAFLANLLQGLVTQLLQVLLGLFDTDKRAGNTNVYLFATLGIETNNTLRMFAGSLQG